MNKSELCEKIKVLGAYNCAVIKAEQIVYDHSLSEACKQNYCGNYGRNWMCPPAVGEPERLVNEAKKYPCGLLFQTVFALEDSFDFEGMTAAKKKHQTLTESVRSFIKNELGGSFLTLGVGGCDICPRCSKPEDKPCRFPDRAIPSMEAFCIFVAPTAEACGMKYINGADTVTYFSIVLFNDT